MRASKLTAVQRANIRDLARSTGIKVAYVGVDKEGLPVIRVKDANGIKFIAWRPEGPGTNPLPPVTDYTEDELLEMLPRDLELLYGLPYAVGEFENPPTQPTQEAQDESAVKPKPAPRRRTKAAEAGRKPAGR